MLPTSSGAMRIGSALIHYDIFGERDSEKENLLLLHGNGEDAGVFASLVPILAPHFTVITMDSRGHGRSDLGDEKLSLNRMAKDVSVLLHRLKMGAINLVGFSDGANIAMILARKRPDLIKRLILIGGNMTPGGVKFLPQLCCELGYYALCALSRPLAKFKKHRDVAGLMVKEPFFKPEELSEIKAPTLVVAGEKDMIRISDTLSIVGAISGSKVCIVPDCDHFIPQKKPQELAKHIFAFVV
ncbi:MAG: alpha/beta hydrolase [Firmicutes bacterium]|nr:alpha/beta hydrolase [Bacillota bacterium]